MEGFSSRPLFRFLTQPNVVSTINSITADTKDLEEVLKSNFFNEDITRVLRDINVNWETWKKQRIQAYKHEKEINKQKTHREIQFQMSTTKYQKGVATVVEAEIDEWTKEAVNKRPRENKKEVASKKIKTTKDPFASAFSADDDNESQDPSLIESDLIEFEKMTDKSCSKPLEILSTGSFVDLRQGGCYYLDKTHFIHKIEDLKTHAILSLRPRRFGKTLFLSTLSSYYDIKNRDRFEQLFGDLYIGKNPTPLASSFLVLELNFSGLRTSTTYYIFDEDFHRSLNIFMSEFMYRYQQELGQHFQIYDENTNALANFSNLLKAVRLSEHKLYVFIDEYDASMNETLKNKPIFQDLTNHKKEGDSVKSKIELIESSFKQFYSRLKTACDKGIAYVFQTGVTLIVMAEFTSGFNISTDLALREEFWNLYGFKKSEVEVLLENISENGFPNDIKNGIIKWLENEYGGYYFNPDQKECIFNTGSILYSIKMLIGRIKHIEYCKDTSIIIKKLLRFPPDPHTLPSQTTLDLIVDNPSGKSILTEAIGQFSLESKNGIEQRFRLANIRELATDRTPLLSFLFYTGALTYQPNGLCFSFRIPNNISKREFIAEALKIHEWKDDDLTPVRQCLQILEGNDDIDPLCRFVEELLLKPLKDNSIVHSNEEVLKQTFLDTLILTLHADIEPEFQVCFNSKYSCGKAIDLVKTSTGKRIAIEFDNIKMECIKLDGIHDSWQGATRISLSLMKKSEDEILNLEISDHYRSNQKTVREVLDSKIRKKCNDYLEPLKNRRDADLKCMFVVLRVGLHRLISRRVY
ncbi:12580_t:CDS:2 [Funneliformis mosseae]|uniref:12580_t:CDS:1 n=1 Tax=Funneliformis mosseae TaxID=27381 RepID=A0A9N8Z9N1_FUNMO|nr:12580_t:CDS:2 [Funneliformis mosseae]